MENVKKIQKLLTDQEKEQLLQNGKVIDHSDIMQLKPVVRFHIPDMGSYWLLVYLDDHDHRYAFGICKHGGKPTLRFTSLADMEMIPNILGKQVEKDEGFFPTMTLGEYLSELKEAENVIDSRSV